MPTKTTRWHAITRRTVPVLTGLLAIGAGYGGLPAAEAAETPILANLTFEQLARIEVTSITRSPTTIWQSPAAITVITPDDMAHAGATSIPEALRWVPGLNVAQINANAWAIGARGFQWQFANKLLVMIDGRSVYSPSTGGVRWEDNTIFLEDLDRIEVVRGPGSSAWGANAVNGVVNIVTRSAFDTLGTHTFAGGGTQLLATGGIRHGWRLSPDAAIRVYGQFHALDDNILPTGRPADDSARSGQGGFRLDWKPTTADSVTVQGDLFSGVTEYQRTIASLAAAPTYAVVSDAPIRSHGANLLGRWRRDWGESSYLEWQNYWDWVELDRPQYGSSQHILDTDLVWGSRLGARQEITGGLGYRHVDGRQSGVLMHFQPETLRTGLFSAFVQDQISLVPEHWLLTLGTKIEHNSFTGWEPQPTLRLAWTPSSDTLVWGSVARAVRTPTWSEETAALDATVLPPGVLDPTLPVAIRILGNPDLQSERLTAVEVGARWKTAGQVSVDVAGYFYDYADYVMASYNSVTFQTAPAAEVLGAQFINGIAGEAYGGELTLRWQAGVDWQVLASYSYAETQLHTSLSDPLGYEQDENTTPHHTVRLESELLLGRDWSLYAAGRYVDSVPYYTIPAYIELDATLTWKPSDRWRVSLAGRNLLDNQHPEYDSAVNRRLTEIRRSVSLIARWNY
ncbi:MAG: TonB-dependent receptor [Lacunisphaera sp.]|nr:TonB-dependent receptor [Lacunisphaera sp.]